MTFAIPNQTETAHPELSAVDATHVAILVAAHRGDGVLSGLAVSARSPAASTLDVAPGVFAVDGVTRSYAGGTVAIPANGSAFPRKDLVTVGADLAASVLAGTPAATPALPALPAGRVAVAEVFAPAKTSAVGATQVVSKRVGVRDRAVAHVVVGDGTNQTAQLRSALVAARDHPTIKTVRVLGTVLIDPTNSNVSDDALSTVVYDGCALEGVGHSSELRLRQDTTTDGQDYHALRYKANVVLRDFRINGNKAAVATRGAAWVDHAQRGIIGTYPLNATNITFENLWIHDLFAKGSETFGWLTSAGESNIRVRGCRTWNIDGTGLSASGLALTEHVSNVEIADCSSWNNLWQGFSVYGCDDVRLLDCRAWGNKEAGLNVEWSAGIDIHDCLSYANGIAGLTTYGEATVRLHGCRLFGNNARGYGNEIMPQWATSGAVTRGARLVEVRDCVVLPPAGSAHVWYSVNAATTGGPVRPPIRVLGPDVEAWVVQNNDDGGHASVSRLAPRPPAKGGIASVANGGTIAHGLGVAPTRYGATATVAGQVVAVTAASATTLTVALLTSAGVAVTAPTNVAWWAEAN